MQGHEGLFVKVCVMYVTLQNLIIIIIIITTT